MDDMMGGQHFWSILEHESEGMNLETFFRNLRTYKRRYQKRFKFLKSILFSGGVSPTQDILGDAPGL